MSLTRWVMVFSSLIFNSFLCSSLTAFPNGLARAHFYLGAIPVLTMMQHCSSTHREMLLSSFPKFLVRIPGSLHVFLSNGIANVKRVSSLNHPSLRSMLTLVPRSPRKRHCH